MDPDPECTTWDTMVIVNRYKLVNSEGIPLEIPQLLKSLPQVPMPS